MFCDRILYAQGPGTERASDPILAFHLSLAVGRGEVQVTIGVKAVKTLWGRAPGEKPPRPGAVAKRPTEPTFSGRAAMNASIRVRAPRSTRR